MIDWFLANHRRIARWSRWIVLACVVALLGIAQLPHNAIDRMLGVAGLIIVGIVFIAWLALTTMSLAYPQAIERLRQRRGRR